MSAVVQSAFFQLLFGAQVLVANDLGNAMQQPSLNKKIEFLTGVAANQADLLFSDERTVGISTNDDIDLAGVLLDVSGAVITNAKIVGLAIVADAANTNTLSVGGGTNPWVTPWIATGDGAKIPPGGMMALVAPDLNGLGAVVAGSSDILRIANGSGSTSKYKIVILGRSA